MLFVKVDGRFCEEKTIYQASLVEDEQDEGSWERQLLTVQPVLRFESLLFQTKEIHCFLSSQYCYYPLHTYRWS